MSDTDSWDVGSVTDDEDAVSDDDIPNHNAVHMYIPRAIQLLDDSSSDDSSDSDNDVDLLLIFRRTPTADYLRYRPIYSHILFDIANTVQAPIKLYRFQPDEIYHLFHEFEIPDTFCCHNRCIVSGLEAFCMLLRRFAYPSRLEDLVSIFRRDMAVISYAVNGIAYYLYTRFKHLFTFNIPSFRHKLPEFAAAVENKTHVVLNCVGFIDGTFRRTCRPGNTAQRAAFSGHKRCHGM